MKLAEYIDPRSFFKLPQDMQYKEKKQYFTNPFVINSTKEIWNKKIDLVNKVASCFFSVLYEVCFTNLYNLTFGNYQIFLENKKIEDFNAKVKALRESKWVMAKHYTKGVIKLIGFTIGVAAITHLLGSTLLLGGKPLVDIAVWADNIKKIAFLIIKSGPKNVGRYLLSAPLHAVCFDLPKYLISKIPTLISNLYVNYLSGFFPAICAKVIKSIFTFSYSKITGVFTGNVTKRCFWGWDKFMFVLDIIKKTFFSWGKKDCFASLSAIIITPLLNIGISVKDFITQTLHRQAVG